MAAVEIDCLKQDRQSANDATNEARKLLRKALARIAELEAENEAMRGSEGRFCTRIAELEWGLAGSRDLVKDLKRNRITEEQIDAAWEFAERHGYGHEMLGPIHIVACKTCKGKTYTETDGLLEECFACHRNGKSHGWVWAIDGLSTPIDGGDDE
jgi:hypothetical protein